MKETIRFKGLSLNKDEQSAQHGELALCGNVELHDGALRPYQVDGTYINGGEPLTVSYTHTVHDVVIVDIVVPKLLYIHQTAAYRHYISIYSHTVFGSYPDVVDEQNVWHSQQIHDFGAADIISIKSVGNTLCVMASDGIHYILCKNTGNGWQYNYLGQKPPFLELQFNLRVNYTDLNDPSETYKKNGSYHEINIPDGVVFTDAQGNVTKEIRSSITDQVMSEINWRIQTYVGKGYFYAPFLLRYCYRLYDGTSLIMHSPPVLMTPMLHHPVMTLIQKYDLNTRSDSSYIFRIFMFHATLQMKCVSSQVITDLQNWSDIVKSVDIFVTPQFSRIYTADVIKSVSINYTEENISIANGLLNDIEDIFEDTYTGYPSNNWYSFDLPEYAEGDFFKRIGDASAFFKLCSYPVSGTTWPTTDFAAVSFEEGTLTNITVQEQMTDDYKTHNDLIPDGANGGGLYVYNHRLNVYGISEVLFEGFSPKVMFPYVDDSNALTISKVSVFVQTDSGLRRMDKTVSCKLLQWQVSYGYCFYPDSRAIGILFTRSGGITPLTAKSLEDHPSLNGARRFYGVSDLSLYAGDGSEDAVVPLSNKIYTSRADNPFYFPNLPGESGINTVGTGDIIGIAAVTRPLVQGEVGRQNLVVFATDGIWVCEVSSTGTYSSMRNLSREVCVNRESICQMDQSILFATNRSLSRFVESDVVSISEVLDGPIFDAKTKMTDFYNYLRDNTTIKALAEFKTSPLNFFRDGQELYDYTGSRVLVFPKDISSGGVALMYSIRDGAWSTMVFPVLKTVVNSYPSPYIQKGDGAIFRLDKAYDYYANTQDDLKKGVIITRTLTFSDTMDVLRGFRQYCDSQVKPLMFFYGSNDQRTWIYIGRSNREFSNYMPGHPYRFFRVAMVLQMYPSEEYQQLELEIVNKYAKL